MINNKKFKLTNLYKKNSEPVLNLCKSTLCETTNFQMKLALISFHL